MTARQLFSKTMPYVWAKLVLGIVMVLICALLLALFLGLGWLFGTVGMVVMAIVWLFTLKGVRWLVMDYFGYMVKAGHIAVIAEACFTGRVPSNQVAYGKDRVKERFLTSNIYYAVDKLVTEAVKEIQRGIGKLGNALDFIPGMEAITGLAQFFVSISLGYIDECCLGWTFYKQEQGAFKSAADGVVIYAQNWKSLLKDAAMTMVKVILLTMLIALIIFVPIGLLFKLLNWNPLIAFLLALLIAWAVKFAAMDSYIMIQMMATYMRVAPNTVITFDLYGKLCSLSEKFKELFNKGQEEDPQPAYAAQSPYTVPNQPPQAPPAAPQDPPRARFCGECGARNEAGVRFCGSCGAKL